MLKTRSQTKTSSSPANEMNPLAGKNQPFIPVKTNPLVNALTGEEVTDNDLKSLRKLIAEQMGLASDIASLQINLDKLTARHTELSTALIPEAMRELGLSMLTTEHGALVKIQPYYSAKIPDDQRDKAYAWLRKHGHDGLIKNLIEITFGKGGDKESVKIAKILDKQGVPYEKKESIHPQTLKAFVKEMIEGGKNISRTMFGIYEGHVTKIVVPQVEKQFEVSGDKI